MPYKVENKFSRFVVVSVIDWKMLLYRQDIVLAQGIVPFVKPLVTKTCQINSNILFLDFCLISIHIPNIVILYKIHLADDGNIAKI